MTWIDKVSLLVALNIIQQVYTSDFLAQETTNIGNQTWLAGKWPLCVCVIYLLKLETADFLASSVRLSTNSWEICPGTMVKWPGGSRKMPAKQWTAHELVHREIWIVPSYPSALLFSVFFSLFSHGPFCLCSSSMCFLSCLCHPFSFFLSPYLFIRTSICTLWKSCPLNSSVPCAAGTKHRLGVWEFCARGSNLNWVCLQFGGTKISWLITWFSG